ncbi:MAG TPA: zinc ABC transporter substrate-binding protein [Pseudolysinimonas sp.]|nr:zinc ABC transporter substrate-binding protein [Pseudolysinimonas sp.]
MPEHRALLTARAAAAVVSMLTLGLALTACSGSAYDPPAGIRVVASTDVYGSLATTIGGAQASVTSIIDDPAKDPHEYQADARTQLAVSRAQVVIENGGGYDDFIDTMLGASGNAKAALINAVKLSGYDSSIADFNEHVFYDYATVGKVVDAIVSDFSKADPSHRALFADRGAALQRKLSALEQSELNLSGATTGVGVAITEPVPNYLLAALGMTIVTPIAFSEAVDRGTDAPATVLQQTLETLTSGAAKLLVYNVQAGGPQSDAVLAAAKKAGIPAVPVSETLPPGLDYVTWQRGVLATIAQALGH